MTGRWKAWKTTNRFPPLPTAPWKSRKDGEISTFPPPGVAPRESVENQRAVSHTPPRRSRRRLRVPLPNSKTKPSGVPPERQEKGHASRSSAAAFSVSPCVGNESRFQYHSSIGKCYGPSREAPH